MPKGEQKNEQKTMYEGKIMNFSLNILYYRYLLFLFCPE